MSKSRAKGTEWETRLLAHLRVIFGAKVERAGTTLGRNDYGDFLRVPYPIEAKKTDVPHFLQWAKVLQRKSANRWACIWSGDQRRKDGPFVMMPMAQWFEFAEAYEQREFAAGALQGEWERLMDDYRATR